MPSRTRLTVSLVACIALGSAWACGGGSSTTNLSLFGSPDAGADGSQKPPSLTFHEGGAGSTACVHTSDCTAGGPCTVAKCVVTGGQEFSQGECVYTPTDTWACFDAGTWDAPPEVTPCLAADGAAPPMNGYLVLATGSVPNNPNMSGIAYGMPSSWHGVSDMWLFDGAKWTASCGYIDNNTEVGGGMLPDDGGLLVTNPLPLTGGPYVQIQTWNGGATWADVPSTTPAPPGATDFMMMAPLGGKFVLVDDSTWTWDGTSWTDLGVKPPNFVVYGGISVAAGKFVLLDQEANTWTFDGTAWTELAIAGPSPRVGYVVATLGDSLVLFGGFALAYESPILGDTWMFDGTTWTEIQVPGPAPRAMGGMAEFRGADVLFGGATAASTVGDTWIFNGSTWQELSISGPSARIDPLMATP